MVTLPPQFIGTYIPGYFWNIKDKTLYSIKIIGILRKMKRSPINAFCKHNGGYHVSHLNRRRFLSDQYLAKLKMKDSVIEVIK